MSSKGWYSKQDVVKDLVEVTGKCFDDFDEHYVVGENPPPAWRTGEDNEDVLSSYGEQKPKQFGNDKMEKPDLAGITQMLRMVDNYNERPNGFSTSNDLNEIHLKSKTTETESANVIVSISKLDPNVKEFIPQKCVSSNNIGIENKVGSIQELKMTKDVNVANVKATIKTDCCETANTNIGDNRIDISCLLSNELKEMRDQLKSKICDTSKAKCVKLKRERNLAIATLLKLYCQQPANDENKPNLMSPDYFKTHPANQNDITKQNVKKDSNNDNITENNLNISSEAQIIKNEIAASVEKVTRWLHNSESEKKTEQNDRDVREPTANITEIGISIKKSSKGLLHLGPVTFKRKTNNNKAAMSPVSLQSDNSKTKSESFVPSAYASELAKKYIHRSKEKQESETDIWKSIETQLREKDEAIKKKRFHNCTN